MHINFLMEEQDVSKLIVSAIVGASIGLEREYRGKPAGFKTMMLICLGSTLFTIFSIKLGTDSSHDRIAANIITGIGFIGAGAIFKDRENMVSGLTTATIIWIISAIGMGIGSGEMLFSVITAAMVLLLMLLSPLLEKRVAAMHKVRTVNITFTQTTKLDEIAKKATSFGLKPQKIKWAKNHNSVIYSCNLSGNEATLNRFFQSLMDDPAVEKVEM
ncbi:MAG: MgtC/SapB family protein [Bacteroidota bacterium]